MGLGTECKEVGLGTCMCVHVCYMCNTHTYTHIYTHTYTIYEMCADNMLTRGQRLGRLNQKPSRCVIDQYPSPPVGQVRFGRLVVFHEP